MSLARLLLAAALSLSALSATAAVPANARAGVAPALLTSQAAAAAHAQPVCRGCGCRGGAGYRLANGKCAGRR